MKVRVKNFQAIESAELELKGLTVITGRSNVGKSCLMRAITAAIFGWPGDHYIRVGQDYCGVVIEDGPDKVIWRKVKNPTPTRQTALRVGDNVHTKIGRDHAELTKEIGIVELPTSVSKQRPQIARQHDTVFLLTETETTVAEVFKMLGRVDVITTAQAMTGKDRRSAVNTRQVREVDRRDLQEELDAMPDLVDLRGQLGKTREKVTKCFDGVYETNVLKEELSLFDELGKEPHVPDVPIDTEVPRQHAVLDRARIWTERIHEEAETEIQIDGLRRTISQLETLRTELEERLELCPLCGRSFA